MSKEELEKELNYVNSVIKDLRTNDEDSSFYYFQRNAIEKELKECETNEGQD
ncbi:MAG: hypothetical protein IJH55_03240 [Romboutsia sp.]|nr:hypothetical protein [Romboutsia sp.]